MRVKKCVCLGGTAVSDRDTKHERSGESFSDLDWDSDSDSGHGHQLARHMTWMVEPGLRLLSFMQRLASPFAGGTSTIWLQRYVHLWLWI